MEYQQICYQCNYGERENLREPLRKLVTKYPMITLGVSVFVNNIPYNLEFYIILEYQDNNIEKDLRLTLEPHVSKELSVLTSSYLMKQICSRRFNSLSSLCSTMIDPFFDNYFFFIDKQSYLNKGYSMSFPNFPPHTIFFSYSLVEKKDLETIYSYLIGSNLPVFFDLNNIIVSENIDTKIKMSITDCSGLVFFVNEKFLNSKWCEEEETLAKSLRKRIIYIVDTKLNNEQKLLYKNILHIEQDFCDFDHKHVAKEILKVFV